MLDKDVGVIDCLNSNDPYSNNPNQEGERTMSINVQVNVKVEETMKTINELKDKSVSLDIEINKLESELQELEVSNKEVEEELEVRREQLIASNANKEALVGRLLDQVEAARKSLEKKEQILKGLVTEEDNLEKSLEDIEEPCIDLDVPVVPVDVIACGREDAPVQEVTSEPTLIEMSAKDKLDFMKYFNRKKYPVEKKLLKGDYEALIRTIESKEEKNTKGKLEWLHKLASVHSHMFNEICLADLKERIESELPF